jgi:two-component system, NtrC family, sensor histidine kinase HydH
MRFAVGARWQTALVILLFLGSLAALFFNSVTAFLLPGEEPRARDEASAAVERLAREGEPIIHEALPRANENTQGRLQRRLSDIAGSVLVERPGVEGGFYLAGDHDQFTGGAFPTERRPPPRPPPPGRDAPPPPPPPPPRRDPPPQEAPYIRQQIRDCLADEPGAAPVVRVLDVGPSRVVIAAVSVDQERPAPAAAWAMIRLTGPEQQHTQTVRYQISTVLALAGILLSLLLTANLAWTLRRERARRETLVDELRRSEHLASLGRLLAGVAHEVRNPLAGIRSTVQLWQRLPDQAQTPASLDAVLQAVDRLNALVGRLLYFARTGWEEPRPVDLNAVVRETVELVRAQADMQGVRLETDLAAILPRLAGSPQALQQVVLNLATNALQAMPTGGRLSLQTRASDGPRRAEPRVADTGPGVSAEVRPHLFEPFYTTRPEGTGLGLALCREIVRQHGGDIDLEAGDSSGAVFRVWLPEAGEPVSRDPKGSA